MRGHRAIQADWRRPGRPASTAASAFLTTWWSSPTATSSRGLPGPRRGDGHRRGDPARSRGRRLGPGRGCRGRRRLRDQPPWRLLPGRRHQSEHHPGHPAGRRRVHPLRRHAGRRHRRRAARRARASRAAQPGPQGRLLLEPGVLGRHLHRDLRVRRRRHGPDRGQRRAGRAAAVLAGDRRRRQPAGPHHRRVRRAGRARHGRLPNGPLQAGPPGPTDVVAAKVAGVSGSPGPRLRPSPAPRPSPATGPTPWPSRPPAASRSRSAGASPGRRPGAPPSPACPAPRATTSRWSRSPASARPSRP
jgi:hypothetical protein